MALDAWTPAAVLDELGPVGIGQVSARNGSLVRSDMKEDRIVAGFPTPGR